jgi:hypothetical protein
VKRARQTPLLPEGQPWAEFLRPRGFRVKTARPRSALSQGLARPTSIHPGGVSARGTDVRDALGVVKFEPTLPDSR